VNPGLSHNGLGAYLGVLTVDDYFSSTHTLPLHSSPLPH